MANSPELEQALEAHRQLLNAHLDIWKTVQLNHAQQDRVATTARECLTQTEQMIQQCSKINLTKLPNGPVAPSKKNKNKRALDVVEDEPRTKKTKTNLLAENDTSNEPPARSSPKKVPVTTDPSGLFQIDSNPADINVLLGDAKEKPKSKKKQKKPKGKSLGESAPVRADSSEQVELDLEVPPNGHVKPTNGHFEQDAPDGTDNYQETFEQKVALRLKEKEEDRKKKANKKRKRESEVSIEEDEVSVGIRDKHKPSKKQKSQAAEATEAVPDVARKATKRKKGNKDAAEVSAEVAVEVGAEAPAEDAPEQQKPKKKKRKKST